MTFLAIVLLMISCFVLISGILSGNLLFIIGGIVGLVIFGYYDYYLLRKSKDKSDSKFNCSDISGCDSCDDGFNDLDCDNLDCSNIDVDCSDLDCGDLDCDL